MGSDVQQETNVSHCSQVWNKGSSLCKAKKAPLLAHPVNNKKTKSRVIELATTAAEAILTKLHDERKATNKYLSSSGLEYSWKHCSEERKKALLGTTATNDQAESTLGGCTSQIQRFGRIALSSATAISDMGRNGFLHCLTGAKHDKNPRGMFHEFDENLHHAIVKVTMRDAPVTRERNNDGLELQATARRVK